MGVELCLDEIIHFIEQLVKARSNVYVAARQYAQQSIRHSLDSPLLKASSVSPLDAALSSDFPPPTLQDRLPLQPIQNDRSSEAM